LLFSLSLCLYGDAFVFAFIGFYQLFYQLLSAVQIRAFALISFYRLLSAFFIRFYLRFKSALLLCFCFYRLLSAFFIRFYLRFKSALLLCFCFYRLLSAFLSVFICGSNQRFCFAFAFIGFYQLFYRSLSAVQIRAFALLFTCPLEHLPA